MANTPTAEEMRLSQNAEREAYWTRFGPYLADREWGTVREDYSKDGECWESFTHEDARSRAYRWGEDGLLGLCDRQGRICFAAALWNGRDPFLKERLFGLNGKEGNHGEDVKEVYAWLDGTPTSSYAKGVYRYPLAEFPYARLREENARRRRDEPEFELTDTGIFDDGRFVDLYVEYAKADAEDVLIRLTLENHANEPAELHLLAQLWFHNHWSWGRTGEAYGAKPRLERAGGDSVKASHFTLGNYRFVAGKAPDGAAPEWLFTENESNRTRLFGAPNDSRYVKDAFHDYVVNGKRDAVDPTGRGTKCAATYRVKLPARGRATFEFRLCEEDRAKVAVPFGRGFDAVFAQRIAEADEFYAAKLPANLSAEERRIARLASAGLMWSKQVYHFVVREWLEGDPQQPSPPKERWSGRNRDWMHLYNRDVILMPDKWEYPWYAAWDLAFHCVAIAPLDPDFAKAQLALFLREWYMHPSGQMPAYEFEFSDVNPPVHAWAVWRVYKMSGRKGHRDRAFLESCFHKLLLNFTWWVNRKDVGGNHLFSGGFLGLDNIGVFDRSKALPNGAHLEQADGTAWMAFYCGTMLAMALELARTNPAYQDLASKFFEHYVAIAGAINTLGGSGLFDETEGFYYDRLRTVETSVPLKVRSLVGLVPLFTVEVIEADVITEQRGFARRMRWFLREYFDLARHISYMEHSAKGERYLLAIPSRDRLVRVLRYVLDENEFLSPHGVRSLSRFHSARPFEFQTGGGVHRVSYVPGDSDSGLFGGNSNWRGPVWFPMNYLLVEALERYHYFYGDTLKVECPTGSGRFMDLKQVSCEISRRLCSLFLADEAGRRACVGGDPRYADPRWREFVPFHEYFHGDDGRGLGASHQTGWTALVVRLLEKLAKDR
jgi:hypothetical protein